MAFCPFRDSKIFEHFNCKPLPNDPWGSKAKPSYTYWKEDPKEENLANKRLTSTEMKERNKAALGGLASEPQLKLRKARKEKLSSMDSLPPRAAIDNPEE